MTKKREIQAPTLEEALARAAKDMGVAEHDVHYRLIDEGRRGVMGLGQRDVRIEIEIDPPASAAAPDEPEPAPSTLAAAEEAAVEAAPKPAVDESDDDRRGNLRRPPRSDGDDDRRGNRRRRGGRNRRGGRDDRRGPGSNRRSRSGDGAGRPARRDRSRDDAPPAPESGPPMDIPAEALETFHGTVQTMVDLLDLELTATVSPTPSGVRVDLDGADLDAVREHNSEFQFGLQFLLNRMSRRAFPEVGRITVGRSGGGRDPARDQELIAEVREVAGQVQRTGMAKTLHPMNPYERRLVHLTVREYDDLDSRSEGEGFLKTVTVSRR